MRLAIPIPRILIISWLHRNLPKGIQSAPTPPAGSRHSCQPTVKLHILSLVWMLPLGKGWYGGAEGSSLNFPCSQPEEIGSKANSSCCPPRPRTTPRNWHCTRRGQRHAGLLDWKGACEDHVRSELWYDMVGACEHERCCPLQCSGRARSWGRGIVDVGNERSLA